MKINHWLPAERFYVLRLTRLPDVKREKVVLQFHAPGTLPKNGRGLQRRTKPDALGCFVGLSVGIHVCGIQYYSSLPKLDWIKELSPQPAVPPDAPHPGSHWPGTQTNAGWSTSWFLREAGIPTMDRRWKGRRLYCTTSKLFVVFQCAGFTHSWVVIDEIFYSQNCMLITI